MAKTKLPENFQILVLDNNESIAELIGMHLKEMNFTNFDMAYSLKDGLQKINQKEYDLLLLDWNLDDGTCFDLLDRINKFDKGNHSRIKNALVVVITGKDGPEDKKKLEQYKIQDHFVKPFVFDEFSSNLQKAIARHIGKK